MRTCSRGKIAQGRGGMHNGVFDDMALYLADKVSLQMFGLKTFHGDQFNSTFATTRPIFN